MRCVLVSKPDNPGYWSVVQYKYEGREEIYYCTMDEWHAKELHQKLIDSGTDPLLLSQYERAIRNVCRRECDEENAGEAL